MRRFAELRAEFAAIFQKRMMLIALIAIMFVPFLYAGVYLYAFKDPYGELDHLPVAIVNLDKGATHDGKELTVGKDFVEKLKEKATFQWHFVTNKEAQEGLKNQKYYMVIRIPENFSKNATTLMDDHPKHLELEYIPNKAYNFLASQISSSAVEKMKEEVSATITETYAEDMFNSVAKVSDGLKEASDGAKKLNDGTVAAKDGSIQIRDNLKTLAEKSIEFQKGTTDLSSGLSQLQQGQQKLQAGAIQVQDGTNKISNGLNSTLPGIDEMSQRVPELEKGSEQLKAGAVQLQGGAKDWQSKANDLSSVAEQTAKGAKDVQDGITELTKQLQRFLSDPNLPQDQKTALETALNQLNAGSKQVADGSAGVSRGVSGLAKNTNKIIDGATGLVNGATQINDGHKKLAEGVSKLHDGQHQLAEGATNLANGQNEFMQGFQLFGSKLGEATAGSVQLVDGSNKFADGTGQLAKGSTDLTDGMSKLQDGSGELSGKLHDAADETGKVKGSDEKYNMFAKPVEVTTHSFGEVDNYGTGVSPYFISLGLYVGALLLSVIYPLREAAGIPKNGFRWFASKYTVLLIVGVMQSLIIDAVVLFGLDFKVQSEPRFVLFTLITSIAFLSLIQFLVTAFGDVGRFAAIIILILQLTTSAGTYPIEMVNKAMQAFGPLVPMTYSVAGFKAVITSGDYSFMWHNAGVLAMWALGCIFCTNICFQLLHRRCFKKVQPGTDAGAQA
ncbi:YhgE/Pip domain-containing protein [Ectobacillus panaciterrae]|uniref:YhgE/Pip domain-containing protein n=1 Tax=Ectobacillus panaciterrae TaxID=363872 RepID=UPI00040B57B9|nr:YhgE/Pip domain-containing protein [Ectobacillus panaciterrae]